jgi:hypothetical protein
VHTCQFHNELSHIWENTTIHLLADLQAETGRYYNTRIRSRNRTAHVITKVVPPHNQDIKAKYDMHMANETTHAVTGETLNMRKLLLNLETRPHWRKGNYNEYGRLFQGQKGGVKGTATCFFIEHTAVPRGHIPTNVKFVCAHNRKNPIPIGCG